MQVRRFYFSPFPFASVFKCTLYTVCLKLRPHIMLLEFGTKSAENLHSPLSCSSKLGDTSSQCLGYFSPQNRQISKNILRICRNQLQRVVKRKQCFKIWKYLPIFHVSWVNDILLLAGQVNYIKLKTTFIHSEVHRSSSSQLSNSASHTLISHYARARSALSAMSLDHVNHKHFLVMKDGGT